MNTIESLTAQLSAAQEEIERVKAVNEVNKERVLGAKGKLRMYEGSERNWREIAGKYEARAEAAMTHDRNNLLNDVERLTVERDLVKMYWKTAQNLADMRNAELAVLRPVYEAAKGYRNCVDKVFNHAVHAAQAFYKGRETK
jgi:hypothetical protein